MDSNESFNPNLWNKSQQSDNDESKLLNSLFADLSRSPQRQSLEPFQLANSFPPPTFPSNLRGDEFSRMLFMPPGPSPGFPPPSHQAMTLGGGLPMFPESGLLDPGLAGHAPPGGFSPPPLDMFNRPPPHFPGAVHGLGVGGPPAPWGPMGPVDGLFGHHLPGPPPSISASSDHLSALLSESFKESTEVFIQSTMHDAGHKPPTPVHLEPEAAPEDTTPSKLVVVPLTSAVAEQKSKQLLSMLKVRANANTSSTKSPFQTASQVTSTPVKGKSSALKAVLGVSPTAKSESVPPTTPTSGDATTPPAGKSGALKAMLGISKQQVAPAVEPAAAAPIAAPGSAAKAPLLSAPPGIAPPPGIMRPSAAGVGGGAGALLMGPPSLVPSGGRPGGGLMPPPLLAAPRSVAAAPSAAPAPAAPMPNAVLSTPTASAKKPGDTPAAPATASKKPLLFRTTKTRVGSLVTTAKGHQEEITCPRGYRTRPSTYMIVTWTLPLAFVEERRSRGEKFDMVIGLVRYGAYTNSPCIVVKSLDIKNASKFIDANGVSSLRGKIQFHTPKAAGPFVYRLFDHATKESDFVTLSTSEMFYVDIFEYEIINNIKFILDMFREEGSVLKAVQQLPVILRGIRLQGLERHPGGQRLLREISEILCHCLHQVLQLIEQKSTLLDDGFVKKQANKMSKLLGGLNGGGRSGNNSFDESYLANLIQNVAIGESERTGNVEDDKYWAEYRHALKIHSEAHDVLEAMFEARSYLWQPLLPPRMQEYLERMHQCFCPLLQRYFPNRNQMHMQRVDEFGFSPAVNLPSNCSDPQASLLPYLSGADLREVNTAIGQLLPQLLPGPQFAQSRESVRLQVQKVLLASCSDVLPSGTEVVLYGSSMNNFGSEGSDIDMCLVLPQGSAPSTSEEKIRLIERLGEALVSVGMKDVHTRSTARIPIVQFKEPVTGVECDIALSNPLARANTLLLRTYSLCDPRVRELAYIIKHWAKSRCLNSPGDGTLSSYGFILCLLLFLQRRPVPLIPNLQRIPSDWSGRTSAEASRPSMQRWEANSDGDGTLYNTYYYAPTTAQQSSLLQNFARNNTESTAELLVEFFHYYTWKFDHRSHVVSIRHNGTEKLPGSAGSEFIDKLDKAETDAWSQHDRLSIEDPFETWYDVAHVIKSQQMAYIRKEFLRAYTLASRISSVSKPSSSGPDALPESVTPSQFLSVLCEQAEEPPFSAAYKERVERLQF